ncbi:MAG: excinuclease ATPase subunit [Betaproteobacteria bacterium]|nr:excinuclease ATPase subunit [Betaproteobacteria bacterium]
MKKLIILVLSLSFMPLLSSSTFAADKQVFLPIADALNTPEAKEKLSGKVKFYFGNQPHPRVQKTFREDVSNKKTNAFAKQDNDVCNHAFLSAMLAFENRANEIGANAVINIVSFYTKQTYSSNAQFECRVGNLMAGVALKGKFVQITGK